MREYICMRGGGKASSPVVQVTMSKAGRYYAVIISATLRFKLFRNWFQRNFSTTIKRVTKFSEDLKKKQCPQRYQLEERWHRAFLLRNIMSGDGESVYETFSFKSFFNAIMHFSPATKSEENIQNSILNFNCKKLFSVSADITKTL